MNPIYKKTTYQFDITVKVNDQVVDISNDSVVAYIDKVFNKQTPALTVEANLTNGINGIASFELTPSQTDVDTGTYHVQIFWVPFGTTRRFPVFDDKVNVKPTVPKL